MWSKAVFDMHIPPGSARASSLAAIFTPSPYILPPSSITSPRLIPMRNCILRATGSSVLRDSISFWTATAHWAASTTLANSARTLSPGESTIRPRCCSIRSAMISRYLVIVPTVAASSSPIRRLYPATSALKIAVSLLLYFSALIESPALYW